MMDARAVAQALKDMQAHPFFQALMVIVAAVSEAGDVPEMVAQLEAERDRLAEECEALRDQRDLLKIECETLRRERERMNGHV